MTFIFIFIDKRNPVHELPETCQNTLIICSTTKNTLESYVTEISAKNLSILLKVPRSKLF